MDAQSRLHVAAVLVTLTTVALTIFHKRRRRRARVHRQSPCLWQRLCRLGDQLDNVKFHLRKCENCVSTELFRLRYLLVRAKKNVFYLEDFFYEIHAFPLRFFFIPLFWVSKVNKNPANERSCPALCGGPWSAQKVKEVPKRILTVCRTSELQVGSGLSMRQ